MTLPDTCLFSIFVSVEKSRAFFISLSLLVILSRLVLFDVSRTIKPYLNREIGLSIVHDVLIIDRWPVRIEPY